MRSFLVIVSLALSGVSGFAPSGPVAKSNVRSTSALEMASNGGVVITGSAGAFQQSKLLPDFKHILYFNLL